MLDLKSIDRPFLAWFFKIKPFLFVSILFIGMSFLGYLSSLAVLKFDITSATNSKLEVFWNDESKPFSSNKSTITSTKKGRHIYWIIVENFKKSTHFRIDPTREKTNIKIHGVNLYSIQHSPINIDLLNDAESIKDIQPLNTSNASNSYSEFITLSEDSQFEISPIQSKSPLFSIVFLILILGFIFPKKYYPQAFFLLTGSILLYYCLSFNETVVSFRAKAEQAEQVTVFWRDTVKTFSNTRAKKVVIQPGTKYYQVKTSNIGNIEVLYLKNDNKQNSLIIDQIQIKEPGFKTFSYEETQTNINKQRDSKRLIISVILFLLVCLLVLWLIFYYPKNNKNFYIHLFPKLIRVLFLFSFFLVINLAWQADYNIHPDENAHIASVEYFSEYWDPPKIGDARTLNTYQYPWAISRLDDLGISYFLAGKFRHVIQLVFENKEFIARAFNAFIFLLFFVLSKNKRLLLFLTPLLCTPQIWYLYAYSNRGGFVLFLSIMLAWQLVNKQSSLNNFLQDNKHFSDWKTILFPGLLLGILSIEQTNYVLFILFLFSVLLWRLIFFIKHKKIFIYKCFIFILTAASIYGLRHGVDLLINGHNKYNQRMAYAEEHAEPNFRPSIASTKDSYHGLRLRDKGVGFTEIFSPPWDWHSMSFKSFVGFYGYYAEFSPKWYYTYVLLIWAIVLFVIFRHMVFKANWQYKLFSLLSYTAICGGLLMSILFCWLYDFQPQGRYMFPIIPIILVYFWTMFPLWNRHEKYIILSSVLILSLLSFYSFNEVALNYLVST
ncbi:MAG: hypothetical protein V3U87_08820 [Methylococcaceae bacterium]